MLARKHRLTNRFEIDRVKKKGARFGSQTFTLLVYFKDNSEPIRFAFIVSKKVSKLALERNRVKRLVRESLKTLINGLSPGFDCVFVIKTLEISLEETTKELKSALIKSGVKSK